MIRFVPRRIFSLLLAASALSVSTTLPITPVFAQDAALAKVKELNKKAVEAYENLDPEEARKYLQQALAVCAAEGLESHPLKANTHVLMGLVLIGGLKQQDAGLKQFRLALEMQSDARIPKRVSTPEVQSLFDQVAKDVAAAPKAEPKPEPKPEPKKPEPVAKPPKSDGPPTDVKGIFHEPIAESKQDHTIVVKAAVQAELDFDKLVLAYRPEGAADFLSRDMTKDPSGWFVARIPEPATRGATVVYYLEARAASGKALANNGSSVEPHSVVLSAPKAVAVSKPSEGGDSENPGGDADEKEEAPSADEVALGKGKIVGIIGLGFGYGYTSGRAELNPDYQVNTKDGLETRYNDYTGGALAQLLQLVPEVGYQLSGRLMLSVQPRYQVVTGTTAAYDKPGLDRGCLKGCPAATAAFALFAKATYLMGSGAFRPFVAGGLGGGEIRHILDLSKRLPDCGPKRNLGCVDTIVTSGAFVSASVGFWYSFSDSIFATMYVNPLVSIPGFLMNLDVNAGFGLKI